MNFYDFVVYSIAFGGLFVALTAIAAMIPILIQDVAGIWRKQK